MGSMRRAFRIFFIFTALCFGIAASAAASDTDNEKLVQAVNDCAVRLYAELKKEKGNLAFSPYGVSSVMAAAYVGAKGKTALNIARTLQFGPDPRATLKAVETIGQDLLPADQKKFYDLAMANGIWVDKGCGFSDEFTEMMQNSNLTNLTEANFSDSPISARKAVNMMIAEQTSGRIKDLMEAGILGASPKLVLTSVGCFRGDPASPFDKDDTNDAPFSAPDAKTVRVPTMNKTAEFFYMEEKDFQGLELIYADNGLSLVMFLPKTGVTLLEFENSLTAENLNQWLGQMVKKPVSVYVPRFKMKSALRMAAPLQAMGMVNVFTAPPADFSGLNGRKDTALSELLHGVVVEVTENSSKNAPSASAEAPAVVETEFAADHPFVFLIRDRKSGMVLFIGRVINPTES